MLILPVPLARTLVIPGTQSFTTPGTFNFVVPKFTFLEVHVNGAGGAGGSFYAADHHVQGGTGGTSSFDGTLVALGGVGGYGYASAGAAGTASGGDTNTTGEVGTQSYGGAAPGPYGGARVNNPVTGSYPYTAPNGNARGGGGAAAIWYDGGSGYYYGFGGSSGGYVKKTFFRGALAVGATISVVVGAGGVPASAHPNDKIGGYGGNGGVTIIWA